MRLSSSDPILLCVVLAHVALCPYSKVEESFNLQALHDLLLLRHLRLFDHLQFPGVVPRTFIGPLILAALADPILYCAKLALPLLDPEAVLDKRVLLYLCRGLLGALSWLACCRLRNAAASRLFLRDAATEEIDIRADKNTMKNNSIDEEKAVAFSVVFNLLISASFHVPFYMSRTLPNTFALITCMLAFSLWLEVFVFMNYIFLLFILTNL
jgi:alpha-1,6-mannosyltransferase